MFYLFSRGNAYFIGARAISLGVYSENLSAKVWWRITPRNIVKNAMKLLIIHAEKKTRKPD
jgi:hypothetical protein